MNKLNFVKGACAVLALCAATAITLQAQTFGVLHSFDGTDGANPMSALIQGTDGNLYGTTNGGGASGYGTVFKISPAGTLTTLYNFCSQSGCTDGVYPAAGLIQASDGNFYGTTAGDGVNWFGTVFKMTANGALITLYSFCAQSGCADGSTPYASLMQATDGNLYGTTYSGGVYAYGTVFKMTLSGTLTTLHSFSETQDDGALPYSGLIQGIDGKFYGTTVGGGANLSCLFNGCGTIFTMTSSGVLSTFYSFCNPWQSGCPGGAEPYGALVQATDGDLYGTTRLGGILYGGGDGTVFNITPSGTATKLYPFQGWDGGDPLAALIQATDGNLYGTTSGTGYSGELSMIFEFELSTNGLNTLHSFSGADGQYASGALVQHTNGSLYGTTESGGAYGDGTAFVLSMGLAPFVETQPNHGKAGKAIEILGTYMGGASSVTFNGTPAEFQVDSPSLIRAIIPAGATTGTVQVTTPSGVLSSNVPFRVTQ